MEILKGRGDLEAKNLKGKYEPKLEFPEGWGFEPKTLHRGSMDVFGGTTHYVYCSGEDDDQLSNGEDRDADFEEDGDEGVEGGQQEEGSDEEESDDENDDNDDKNESGENDNGSDLESDGKLHLFFILKL